MIPSIPFKAGHHILHGFMGHLSVLGSYRDDDGKTVWRGIDVDGKTREFSADDVLTRITPGEFRDAANAASDRDAKHREMMDRRAAKALGAKEPEGGGP